MIRYLYILLLIFLLSCIDTIVDVKTIVIQGKSTQDSVTTYTLEIDTKGSGKYWATLKSKQQVWAVGDTLGFISKKTTEDVLSQFLMYDEIIKRLIDENNKLRKRKTKFTNGKEY